MWFAFHRRGFSPWVALISKYVRGVFYFVFFVGPHLFSNVHMYVCISNVVDRSINHLHTFCECVVCVLLLTHYLIVCKISSKLSLSFLDYSLANWLWYLSDWLEKQSSISFDCFFLFFDQILIYKFHAHLYVMMLSEGGASALDEMMMVNGGWCMVMMAHANWAWILLHYNTNSVFHVRQFIESVI